MADKPGALPFANDGSFMEMFMKMQQQKQQQQEQPQQPPEEEQGDSKVAAVSDAGAASEAGGTSGVSSSGRAGSLPPVDQRCVPGEEESRAGPSGDDDFIPSQSFCGAKPGYVFKKDSMGLGYYRDVCLQDRLKAAKEAAKQKPVVLKANNPLLKSLGKRGVDLPATVPAKKGKQEIDPTKPKYLQEMEKYKSMSCGADTKHDRPLVK